MTAQVGDTLDSTASQKQVLRRRLRRLRASLDPSFRKRATLAATRHLLRLPCIRKARALGIYLEAGSELSTSALREALHERGVRLYVPVIRSGGEMRFVRLRKAAPLRRNRHHIAEPVPPYRLATLGSLDALIMPLVGFDDRGHRLGAGGGYFDRLLERPRGPQRPRRIGFAFECQRLEALPLEPWDRALEWIVTERGCRRASPVSTPEG